MAISEREREQRSAKEEAETFDLFYDAQRAMIYEPARLLNRITFNTSRSSLRKQDEKAFHFHKADYAQTRRY